ncbi:MAG: hypothetical protein V9G20_19120 [Candidatus Promineifilaceae bacterium]
MTLNLHGLLLRKCRAIWQIARWTIYKIVLQLLAYSLLLKINRRG